MNTFFKNWRSHKPIPWRVNVFRRKQRDDYCHDLKRLCESSGITGKYMDFSKIKLFCQRDNIDVSKKKKSGEVKIWRVINFLLWTLNSKHLNTDCTNIIFSEFCCSQPLWLGVKLANLKHAKAFAETKISILWVTLIGSSGALMPWSKQNKRVNRVLFWLHSYTYLYVAGRMKCEMVRALCSC